MTRILVIEDHPTTRSSIVRILDADPELSVVGQAGTAQQARESVEALRPDVVVLDIDLPDQPGTDLAADLEGSSTRVVVFTAHAGRGFVRALRDAGVAGYVTKDQPESDLLAAVLAVARGESRWLVSPITPLEPAGSLTERELDVLGLLARGLSNKDISDTLFVSASTVRNTLTVVYEKIEVGSAREAIVWAIENGVVSGAG